MKILTTALVALVLAATSAYAVDPTISANCRVGADASYSRANGFCEVIASNKSLADTKGEEPVAEEEVPVVE